MRLLVLLSMTSAAYCMRCVPVQGDQITAADVAIVVPAFTQLEGNQVIGLSPFPGTSRVITSHELAEIARRNRFAIEGPTADACFERALAPLTVDRIKGAMTASIGIEDASIEIVDFMRQPVAYGRIEFPRTGLTAPPSARPDSPAYWRGVLRYSPQHTLPVWASVRITVRRRIVIAVREIPHGTLITAADVVEIDRSIFPFLPYVERTTSVIGRAARKTIPNGAMISPAFLELPPDIVPGDSVHVFVENGGARISFDAVARTGGRKGERVVLLNPESRKTFEAVVDGPSSAHVLAGT